MFLLTDVEGLGSQNLGGVQQLAETGKVRNSAAFSPPSQWIAASIGDMTNVGRGVEDGDNSEGSQPLNNTN